MTPVIWTSDNDNQYTCEQLLALAAEKRLGLQADRMRAAATSEDHDQDQEDHDTQPMD